MQQRRRRTAFTAGHKAEVVELCRKGDQTIPAVARDLGLTESSVHAGGWSSRRRPQAGPG